MGAANLPVPDDLLDQAADLRAAGGSWETIAKAVGRSPETVRRWPGAYPARWKAALFHAERRLLRLAGAEGLSYFRQLLRSENPAVVAAAARGLSGAWVAFSRLDQQAGVGAAPPPDPPPQTPEVARLLAFLSGQPDDELAHLLATLDRFPPHHPVPPPAPGGPGA